MKHPLIKRSIWILIFAILVYTAFAVWSGVSENLGVLRAFPWRLMPVILGAVLLNLVLREFKWDFYRKAAKIQVPRIGSFLIFFSGYAMAISPARAGELIKPFMYKEYFNQKMRRSIPLVLCERISDLLGMIVLAAISMASYIYGIQQSVHGSRGSAGYLYAFLLFSAIFMAGMIWLVRQKQWVYRILIALSRRPKLTKPMHKIRKLYFSTYPLLSVRNLVITTVMAATSWIFECVAILLILRGVGAEQVTFMQATFIFCMSTIVGGFLFFLPGGIGAFEGTCLLMLSLLGVPNHQAVSAIFITRFSTLFFAVALGFLFILATSARYHKRMMWEEFEQAEEGASTEL